MGEMRARGTLAFEPALNLRERSALPTSVCGR